MSKVTLNPLKIFDMKDHVVVILNSPSIWSEVWKQIWNDSRINVCADGAANKLMEMTKHGDYKMPKKIVGDFDSINKGTKEYFIEQGVSLIHVPDQNSPDILKSLKNALIDADIDKHEYVVILGGLCGRLDHTFQTVSILIRFYKEYQLDNVFVYDGCNLLTIINEGETELDFSDHPEFLTKMCGVIPICQRETIVTSTGLQYDMDSRQLAFGHLVSSSNRIMEDKVTIKTNAPANQTFDHCISYVNSL
ncbi:unnamed protein product [Dracunculus medinensis]|uniref:Thiamine diphosphokinase n=1 Tax=Dracunculus medinensis TaxID=318479 RepID=A0A158Q566_DRAME|nr:unnamed protein product [Dracunculus medinensis]